MGRVLVLRGKPVRPTESGEVLVRLARQLLRLEADAAEELGLSEPSTSVAVAVNADSLATWFLPALSAVPPELGACSSSTRRTRSAPPTCCARAWSRRRSPRHRARWPDAACGRSAAWSTALTPHRSSSSGGSPAAGLPPAVAGLFAKLTVFRALIDGQLAWLAAIMAVNTVIALYYYATWAFALFGPTTLEPGCGPYRACLSSPQPSPSRRRSPSHCPSTPSGSCAPPTSPPATRTEPRWAAPWSVEHLRCRRAQDVPQTGRWPGVSGSSRTAAVRRSPRP